MGGWEWECRGQGVGSTNTLGWFQTKSAWLFTARINLRLAATTQDAQCTRPGILWMRSSVRFDQINVNQLKLIRSLAEKRPTGRYHPQAR